MYIGAVTAKAKEYNPTACEPNILANTIIIAHCEAAYIIFPIKVQEKFAMKDFRTTVFSFIETRLHKNYLNYNIIRLLFF